MNLISISPNILINADEICYVEQKKTKRGTVLIVRVSDKEFEVNVPLKDFMNSIVLKGQGSQYWAG